MDFVVQKLCVTKKYLCDDIHQYHEFTAFLGGGNSATPLVPLEDGKNQRHRMTPNQQRIAKANDIEPEENRNLPHIWGEGWADGYECGYEDAKSIARIWIGICGLVILAVWLLIRVWF